MLSSRRSPWRTRKARSDGGSRTGSEVRPLIRLDRLPGRTRAPELLLTDRLVLRRPIEDDVTAIFASAFAPEGEGYMRFDVPNAKFGSSNGDVVLDDDDAVVGLSACTGDRANEARALSLATVDPEVEIGTELRIVWGEPDGGSRKTTVQPHRQKEVRVIVSPVPYSEVVRTSYAEGWRTEQTVS